jgi:hypothetical protein
MIGETEMTVICNTIMASTVLGGFVFGALRLTGKI